MRVFRASGNGLYLALYTEKEEIESEIELLDEISEKIGELLEEMTAEERWNVVSNWATQYRQAGLHTYPERDTVENIPAHQIFDMLTELRDEGWMAEMLADEEFPLKPEPLEDGEDPDHQTVFDMMEGLTPYLRY